MPGFSSKFKQHLSHLLDLVSSFERKLDFLPDLLGNPHSLYLLALDYVQKVVFSEVIDDLLNCFLHFLLLVQEVVV